MVTSRIVVVAIDARDPQRVATFWAAVLGWTALTDPNGVGVSLVPPGVDGSTALAGRGGPSIDVLPVPEGNEFCVLARSLQDVADEHADDDVAG